MEAGRLLGDHSAPSVHYPDPLSQPISRSGAPPIDIDSGPPLHLQGDRLARQRVAAGLPPPRDHVLGARAHRPERHVQDVAPSHVAADPSSAVVASPPGLRPVPIAGAPAGEPAQGVPLHLQDDRRLRQAAAGQGHRQVVMAEDIVPEECVNLEFVVIAIVTGVSVVILLVLALGLPWAECTSVARLSTWPVGTGRRIVPELEQFEARLVLPSETYRTPPSRGTSVDSLFDHCPPLASVGIFTFIALLVAGVLGGVAFGLLMCYSLNRFRRERGRRLMLSRPEGQTSEVRRVAARKYPLVRGTPLVCARWLLLIASILIFAGTVAWLVFYLLVRCGDDSLVPDDLCATRVGLYLAWIAFALVAGTHLLLWMRRMCIAVRAVPNANIY
eukprot:TRINITY_DN7196_c0_g1_i1.p1 TRINITY_DN7196_c0_g1~~TRINITY_DN7196_c0_g1_i1.p1  ORF type:complete len:387 (+),score=57.10 TRINITY_DN7196_c0_g1_i1:128-1288(+)